MHDSLLMRSVYGIGELLHQRRRVLRRQRRAVELLRQATARAIFEREIRLPAVRAEFVDVNDPRMIERGDRFRFREKARAVFFRGVSASEYHFQCDFAIELRLPSVIDNAHAATAEQTQYLVTRR